MSIASLQHVPKNQHHVFDVDDSERARILAVYGETERLIDEKERRAITNISRTTWYRLEQENAVPERKGRDFRCRWLLSDILLFITR